MLKINYPSLPRFLSRLVGVFPFVFIFTCASMSQTPFTPTQAQGLSEDFFPAVKSGEPVRVLTFGDSGTGDENQFRVARAMTKHCSSKETPCDLGVLLGDNFYEVGVSSVNDPQFQEKFEKPYGGMGVNIYPVLGNHDHGYCLMGGNTAAEIEYTQKSKSGRWRMPHNVYNYRAGDVEFFALDTQIYADNDVQYNWLKGALEASSARWKVVYGHHVIHSYGSHGDNKKLIKKLLPLLCEKADIYLAGHEHDMQLLKADCGLPLVVSGAAGKVRTTSGGKRSSWHREGFGFSYLVFNNDRVNVKFYDDQAKLVHEDNFPNRSAAKKSP